MMAFQGIGRGDHDLVGQHCRDCLKSSASSEGPIASPDRVTSGDAASPKRLSLQDEALQNIVPLRGMRNLLRAGTSRAPHNYAHRVLRQSLPRCRDASRLISK